MTVTIADEEGKPSIGGDDTKERLYSKQEEGKETRVSSEGEKSADYSVVLEEESDIPHNIVLERDEEHALHLCVGARGTSYAISPHNTKEAELQGRFAALQPRLEKMLGEAFYKHVSTLGVPSRQQAEAVARAFHPNQFVYLDLLTGVAIFEVEGEKLYVQLNAKDVEGQQNLLEDLLALHREYTLYSGSLKVPSFDGKYTVSGASSPSAIFEGSLRSSSYPKYTGRMRAFSKRSKQGFHFSLQKNNGRLSADSSRLLEKILGRPLADDEISWYEKRLQGAHVTRQAARTRAIEYENQLQSELQELLKRSHDPREKTALENELHTWKEYGSRLSPQEFDPAAFLISLAAHQAMQDADSVHAIYKAIAMLKDNITRYFREDLSQATSYFRSFAKKERLVEAERAYIHQALEGGVIVGGSSLVRHRLHDSNLLQYPLHADPMATRILNFCLGAGSYSSLFYEGTMDEDEGPGELLQNVSFQGIRDEDYEKGHIILGDRISRPSKLDE
ncbi:MAG: hypothetical protein AAGF04_04925 [Chlamydiota bacterium]